MKKEWIAELEGNKIRVTNAWFGGAKLYINGDCRDTNTETSTRSDTPALSARIQHGNLESPLIEVFMMARFTVKAKICLNGKQVAGDIF